MDEKLIFAIGEIDDRYILSAGNRLSRKGNNRKAVLCIAAVLVLMLSSFVTAMALNEDFRENVLSIFSIGKTENVRHSGTVSIDDVSASYMELNDGYILRNGLVYITRDEQFCVLEDGKLIRLETNINSVDLVYNGLTVSLRYAYTVIDGQLHTLELSLDNMEADPLLYCWSITPLRGSRDKAWLTTLREKNGDYSAYPLLLDVRTGDLTDVLHDIDLQDTVCDGWFFSPDNRYAVIRTSTDDMLVDVERKTVTELTDCHESYFLSDGSLICFVSCKGGFDLVRRDPESGTEAALLHNAHFAGTSADGIGYMNIDYYGGAGDHALLVDEVGTVTMLDLKDGSKLLLNGIQKEPGEKIYTLESTDGRRVMVAIKGSGKRSVFRSLGMIDCESGTLRIFDRNNTSDNCGENLLGFTADGSVGIIGMSEKGQWLYVYDFGNAKY